MSHPQRLLALELAARYLGISQRTLRRHTDAGSIPVVRIGRSVRYDLHALDAWIDGQRKPPLLRGSGVAEPPRRRVRRQHSQAAG